nr:MAG TPA: hypothetical protein [Bacteriophage sp.]
MAVGMVPAVFFLCPNICNTGRNVVKFVYI